MKYLFLTLGCILAFSTILTAQTLNDQYKAMNYQAVARDASGDPVTNQNISVKFLITFGLAYAYEETQSLMTNEHGLFTAEIGFGTPTGLGQWNDYTQIDWTGAIGGWGLLVFTDFTGGTTYQSMGFEAFRAVPFANLAHEAEVLKDSAVVVGYNNGYVVFTDPDYNVGIGTDAPLAKLHVEGDVRIADGTEGTGKVLTSDADGNASWVDPVIVGSGSYTPTWTTTAGFTVDPNFLSCDYSRVGKLVTVLCLFGGAGPDFAVGVNSANISVPASLPVENAPGLPRVCGEFISGYHTNGSETSVGTVSFVNTTSTKLKIFSSYSGIAGSWCSFTYRTP